MYCYISCSNCGKTAIVTKKENARELINSGWRTFGRAFYCPSCSATWGERNKTKELNTGEVSLISLLEKMIPDKTDGLLQELDDSNLEEEFREVFIEEFDSDMDGPEIRHLINAVENADIDGVFMALCGWSSETLLGKARERKEENA